MNAPLIKQIRSQRSDTKKIERSFDGIRGALFDEWDAMRSGTATTETVKAASRAAHAIMETLSVQLETIRYTQTNAGAVDKLLK
jgi:hypothetical protein